MECLGYDKPGVSCFDQTADEILECLSSTRDSGIVAATLSGQLADLKIKIHGMGNAHQDLRCLDLAFDWGAFVRSREKQGESSLSWSP